MRLAVRDFPAEHCKHIIPTTPNERRFATVRHRTGITKACLSRKTGLAMAFKQMMSAQTKWHKGDGENRMPEIIQGIEFKDAIKQPLNPPIHAVTRFRAMLPDCKSRPPF